MRGEQKKGGKEKWKPVNTHRASRARPDSPRRPARFRGKGPGGGAAKTQSENANSGQRPGPVQEETEVPSPSLAPTSLPIPRECPEGLRGHKGLQRAKGSSPTAPGHPPRHWAPQSLLVTLARRQASRPAKPLLPLPPFSNLPLGPVRPSQSAELPWSAATVLPLPRVRRGQPEKRNPLFP